MSIRDHVEVIAQPTVVRLDQLQAKDSSWISESYYITEETERHFQALKILLEKEDGCGIFLIGHYGSGKSHFLAYLTQQLEAKRFTSRNPHVLPLSLLNYSAKLSLESILDEALSITHTQKDRREGWTHLMERYPAGLFIIMDELSEFLRSKPSTESYNEDLRFLQFLGEWAQDHPIWILAALQEQIEHTGDIEYDLYRKIKDRYPIRFLLTPAHVKDLIAQRILRKKSTYGGAVEKLAAELKSVYPARSIDYSALCDIYPLHPMTLELLEEVRDRFSQARGIIDFTLTQLLGDEARGVSSFLDRSWGDLITPDIIVDHFSDLFEVQPEFLAISQKVLPYFRKNIPSFFEKEAQCDLAWRLLKLLILVHLSPRRQSLDSEEAAIWLTVRASSIDPGKNIEIVGRVLDVLTERGAFLKRQGNRYRLDLEDDSKQNLDHLLGKELEELKTRGDTVFEELAPLLQDSDFNPFSLPRDRWHTRKVRWHFHERNVRIYFGGGMPPEEKGLAVQIGIPWGPAPEGNSCYRIHANRIEQTPDLLELAALVQLRQRPLPARVLSRIQERISGRKSWFYSLIRTAYQEAVILDPTEAKNAPPLNALQGSHTDWLNAICEWTLRKTYPSFERFAPGYGPLPKEAYREFMKQASEDLGAEDAPDFVKLIREAYLVPMGLMQRKGNDYLLNAKLDSHELVRLLTPIIEHHPSPGRVYDHLSAPVYGLVHDQIHLLLLTLLIQGEIDIVKGQHSYRETYETLSNPQQYDKILPGRALNLNQLRDLQILCEAFRIPVPKQWTVLAQKRAIGQLRKFGTHQREQLGSFAAALRTSGEAGDLLNQVEKVISQWLSLEKGEHELQGFQHFLYEIGSPKRFAVEAEEMALLPDRFEKLLVESRRYRHLFGYPSVRQCENVDIVSELAALGDPPALAEPELLQSWLDRAASLYQKYQEWYRQRHKEWRDSVSGHAIWSYRPPDVSRSKHIGAVDLVHELETMQSKARSAICRGLSALDFQPLCWCGFDGKESPITKVLHEFENKVKLLESELALFFQQDKVKAKVEEWVNQKLEMNPETLSYLEGKSSYPKVENTAIFDQHLSGVELTRSVEAESLLDFLGDGVWEKSTLINAIDRFLSRFGSRIRFRREEPAPRRELLAWCCEQALKQGTPLPAVFTQAEYSMIPEILQPQWVSEKSLVAFEKMGLGEPGNCRVIHLLLDGVIRAPQKSPDSGAVAAAMNLLNPQQPSSAENLAQQIRLLYEQHDRFIKLCPQLWLARLNDLAQTNVHGSKLDSVLGAHLSAQWVVVDCLGAPLVNMVEEVLRDCFPHWKMQSLKYAVVSEDTSTDAFYIALMDGDLKKSFQKVNSIDDLIHNRKLDFNSLVRLSRAELEIAFKKMVRDLDTSLPVVIFGDHGFRINAEGTAFQHGGPSTLERLTPVFVLAPISDSSVFVEKKQKTKLKRKKVD